MQKKHPLQEMLEPLIDEMGFDLVRVITIGNVNPTLQIMIERKDRENIVVDDCAAVSRAVPPCWTKKIRSPAATLWKSARRDLTAR